MLCSRRTCMVIAREIGSSKLTTLSTCRAKKDAAWAGCKMTSTDRPFSTRSGTAERYCVRDATNQTNPEQLFGRAAVASSPVAASMRGLGGGEAGRQPTPARRERQGSQSVSQSVSQPARLCSRRSLSLSLSLSLSKRHAAVDPRGPSHRGSSRVVVRYVLCLYLYGR